MKKKVLRAAGRAAAPRLGMLMSGPGRTAFASAGAWAGRQVMERVVPDRLRPQPKRSTLGMTAAKGLGAAAVAAPLGWWLGRRLMSQGASR